MLGPMARMIAVEKGERGRNRSEYPVRKQGHGQLLAEWLKAILPLSKPLIYVGDIHIYLHVFSTSTLDGSGC